MESFNFNKVQISVVIQNMVVTNCDIMVNSCQANPTKQGGGTHGAILAAGGETLMSYLKAAMIKRRGVSLNPGDWVYTKPGNLNEYVTTVILHIRVPDKRDISTYSHMTLINCYRRVIKYAMEFCKNKEKIVIVLPLLGTGIFTIPVEESIHALMSAIMVIKNTRIELPNIDIKITVYPRDPSCETIKLKAVKLFQEYLAMWQV